MRPLRSFSPSRHSSVAGPCDQGRQAGTKQTARETNMDAKVDDNIQAQCPVGGGGGGSGGGRGGRGGGGGGRQWWPDNLRLEGLNQHAPRSNPMGEQFDYAAGVQAARPDAVIADLHALMTDSAGMVAGGLRPLRRPVHPPGLAQRRHLPHHRRPRRRRRRAAALRAAEQLAGQRQPRQGAAACCGRSSRSTARSSPGPTCSCSSATSPWSPWASRPSATPAAAPTPGSRRSCSGGPRARGSATSATAASASCTRRWARCRWA